MRFTLISLIIFGCTAANEKKEINKTQPMEIEQLIIPGVNQKIRTLFAYREKWDRKDLIEILSNKYITIDNSFIFSKSNDNRDPEQNVALLVSQLNSNSNKVTTLDSICFKERCRIYLIKSNKLESSQQLNCDILIIHAEDTHFVNYILYERYAILTLFDTYEKH